MTMNAAALSQLQETPTQITVSTTATVGYIKVPYNEAYNKDSSEHTWYRRRDVVPGRSTGQVFLTKDNTMVFRCVVLTMFPYCVCVREKGGRLLSAYVPLLGFNSVSGLTAWQQKRWGCRSGC